MPVAISVENLSKKYLISHQKQERYTALRDVLAGSAKAIGRKLMRPFSSSGPLIENDPTQEEFWALKDLNFEIQQGDRVGIIGRNGAGKSTLLKILSRITEPTTGRVKIRGRVASLLEVGTGFHPELTGRENIFLNGAVLGMSKTEITRKFEEIVSFAEVERFLDTPVKRYSSGMYVRLAFSVAAHLDADVLIIDEVLAVGDAAFQRRCLGKIEDISGQGSTVLFVSHNLGVIQGLCTRGVYLAEGRVKNTGPVEEVVREYATAYDAPDVRRKLYSSTCGRFNVWSPIFLGKNGSAVQAYRVGEQPVLRLEFEFLKPVPAINPGVAVVKVDGTRVFTSHLVDDDRCVLPSPLIGRVTVDLRFELGSLAPGVYSIILGVRDDQERTVVYAENAGWLEINELLDENFKAKNGASGILWHTGQWCLAERAECEK